MRLFPDPRPPSVEGIDLRCCDVAEVLADESVRADLVHADPPWLYRNGGNGRASGHYSLISMEEIASHIDASWHLAPSNAYLIIWCTFATLGEWWPHFEQTRWEYKTGAVWVKPGHVGTGFHIRGNAEPIMICTKGHPRPWKMAVNAHLEKLGEHSEKPVSYLRSLVATFCPPNGIVLDLYAGLAPLARACALEGRRYIGAELDPERHRRALGLLAGVRR